MEPLSVNSEAMAGGRERLPYLKLWKGGACCGNEGGGPPEEQPGGRRMMSGAGAQGSGEAQGHRSCRCRQVLGRRLGRHNEEDSMAAGCHSI